MLPYRIELVEATDSLARIRLRSGGTELPAGAKLTGTLTGPRCRYARTLPATYPVRSQTGIADVLITEPCYWTADMPFLYDLRLEVMQGDTVIDRIEQLTGLRRLNVRGPHVFVEGKRFVFRAARCSSAPSADWTAWRDARLAMYVIDPDHALCQKSSEQGVWIIAEVNDAAKVSHIINCPAVAIVVVPQSELASLERLPGGPLLGMRTAERRDDAKSSGMDLLVNDVADVAAAKQALAGYPWPVLAVRSIEEFESLPDARAACELLQRDLTPELNLAGYIV